MRTRRKEGFLWLRFFAGCAHEIDAFFRREHANIIPLTVRKLLDEQIAQKLA